jgi:hypothetical protein
MEKTSMTKMSKRRCDESDISEHESSLVGTCQSQLLQSQIELSGLSALFKNMGDCEFTSDELHGIGISLDRIAEQMSVSLSNLSKASTPD